MKKPMQNVLAQNSDGSIAYVCGKCYKEIGKEDAVCKHCGARLGNIKCPFCHFTGNPEDFRNDTCPKCGRKTTLHPAAHKKSGKGKYGTGSDKNDLYLSNKVFWLLILFLFITMGVLAITFLAWFDLI